MPSGIPPELQLMLSVQLFVLLGAAILVCISTIALFVRTRTKAALAMLVAIAIGLSGQAIGYFGPHETIVEPPVNGAPEQGSSPAFIRGAGTRNRWETPAFWLAMSGISLWIGGFVAHSFSVSRKER